MRATEKDQGQDKSFPVKDEDFRVASRTSDGCEWVHCVEVAIRPEGVAVRDSKNRDKGILFFTIQEWEAFLDGVSKGEFNL